MQQSFRTIEWQEAGVLVLLDQRRLPGEEQYVRCAYPREVSRAITDMVVRGAPAIGVAAAFGAALSARLNADHQDWRSVIMADLEHLANARPTAVNLQWAIDHMAGLVEKAERETVAEKLLEAARSIEKADRQACQQMADHAKEIFLQETSKPFSVLTHCNTGALATAGCGTALGAIITAWRSGMIENIYADETRPWFQGSRLTAWELHKADIPVHLIADSAAATVLRDKGVAWVVVGADRIAANGDVANKIGTYSLAVLCRYHQVKFMVVAPTSTIDMQLATGESITIEQRSERELIEVCDNVIAPENINVFNPVFDVTPAALVDVLVTEQGAIHQPNRHRIAKLFDLP